MMKMRSSQLALSLLVSCLTNGSALEASTLPKSTHQQLVDKSKVLNPQPYSAPGWSNRAATTLTPVCPEGVYSADRPFYWNKIDVGGRSCILELPSKTGGKPDLWVHSPVSLDRSLQTAVESVGNVKYVVSPNYEHLKYAPEWRQNYPDAEPWGCPGLIERMSETIEHEIPYNYRPAGWKGASKPSHDSLPWDTDLLEALHIDCEVNPFTGKPFFNEVIFYHRPSKSLITTDLFWNYPASVVPNSEFGRDDTWELAPTVEKVPLGSRLWKFGMDQVYLPFYNKLMVQDKEEYKAIANHILNEWDVETVIPCHGDILRGKSFIRDVLSKHFGL